MRFPDPRESCCRFNSSAVEEEFPSLHRRSSRTVRRKRGVDTEGMRGRRKAGIEPREKKKKKEGIASGWYFYRTTAIFVEECRGEESMMNFIVVIFPIWRVLGFLSRDENSLKIRIIFLFFFSKILICRANNEGINRRYRLFF